MLDNNRRWFKNKSLTNKTDKISFFYFILRVKNVFLAASVVKSTKHLNHKKQINYKLEDLKYMDILDLAFTYIST